MYRLYDYSRLKPLFNAFQNQSSGAFYTDLFWLGLEGAPFSGPRGAGLFWRHCGGSMPSRVTAQPRKGAEREGIQNLRWLWYRRALGAPAQEDPWEKGVLDDLTFPPECTEEQLTDRMEALLYRWFRRARRSVTDRQWAAFAGPGPVSPGEKKGGA